MRRIIILSWLCWMGISGCNDKVEPDVTSILSAFPNPFMELGFLQVTNNTTQDATLKVFDPTGEIILNEIVKPGSRMYNFDSDDRPTGKYQVIFKVGTNEYTEELIKI